MALRKALLISLDDLLAVVREFLNPHVSRSGLDRCLRRHGVGNLRDLKAKAARAQTQRLQGLRARLYPHRREVSAPDGRRDVAALPLLRGHRPRATRWVFIRMFKAKTAANARRFLRDLERACPMRIRTILTDNGKEFTDRLFGLRKRAPDRRARVRQVLCRPGHRPPPDPRRNPLRQTVWSNGLTVESKRCSKAITSDQARSWRLRCTAMFGSTTNNSRNQPWAVGRPCRQ